MLSVFASLCHEWGERNSGGAKSIRAKRNRAAIFAYCVFKKWRRLKCGGEADDQPVQSIVELTVQHGSSEGVHRVDALVHGRGRAPIMRITEVEQHRVVQADSRAYSDHVTVVVGYAGITIGVGHG